VRSPAWNLGLIGILKVSSLYVNSSIGQTITAVPLPKASRILKIAEKYMKIIIIIIIIFEDC